MDASIADSTRKQYDATLKYWWNFCIQSGQDPFSAGVQVILRCLTKRFQEGAAYGTLNMLRAAISLISDCDCSNSLDLHWFFKGVYRLRPLTSKFHSTWDVNIIFKKLDEWGQSEVIDLQKLSLKLVILLALGSAFRVQALAKIKMSNIIRTEAGIEIRIQDLLKTSRPGEGQFYPFFPLFDQKLNLGIARNILLYIHRTQNIRVKAEQLLISFKAPYKPVGKEMISRWIKTVMQEAGISERFTAHSTRHAATSKALLNGVDLNTIKSAAGWSKGSKIYAKFYNRPIEPENGSFSEAVFNV